MIIPTKVTRTHTYIMRTYICIHTLTPTLWKWNVYYAQLELKKQLSCKVLCLTLAILDSLQTLHFQSIVIQNSLSQPPNLTSLGEIHSPCSDCWCFTFGHCFLEPLKNKNKKQNKKTTPLILKHTNSFTSNLFLTVLHQKKKSLIAQR